MKTIIICLGLLASQTAFAERSVTMFLALTGAPSDDAIERKLDALKSAGVDSFMLYPTSGMRLGYLGEEFFRCARAFAAGAERRGMKMWLYDEYNWPSGSCRGRVPSENERWRYAEVSYRRSPTGGVDKVITRGPKGWVSLLEPDAVDRFIELTYGAYGRHLARWIGNGTVRGIFTDEPGHPVKVDRPPGAMFHCRWWSTLDEDYCRETGRDLDADVAANAVDGAAYARMFGRRFRTAYYDRARAAARRLGIEFCGHLISDSSSDGAIRSNGDPLLALRGETMPGIDEIWSDADPAHTPFFLYALGDHAISRNGNGGMAELFACGPCDMPPERMRRMIWLAALHGVTRYFLVMSAMDMSWMEQMRGFSTVMGEYQPWFAEFRTLLDEADRASAFASRPFVRDAAVRYPQDAIAAAVWKGPRRDRLDELLREIELEGFTPDLIAQGETSSLPVVFAFYGAEIVDEASGLRFADARAAVAHLAAVRKVEGRRRNVILRRHADGTRAELDLGVVPAPRTPGAGDLASRLDWQVTLDSPNRRRVNFGTNGVGRIRAAAPLRGVRVAVRRHVPIPALEDSPLIAYASMCEGQAEQPPPYVVTLDGRTLAADRPCDCLRPGFDSLYGMTAAFDLEAGEHEFRIVSGRMDDNFFLPVAVLAGEFVEQGGALAALSGKIAVGSLASAGLAGYAGSATYSAMVDVPAGRRLAVASGNAFTRVTLGGIDLGVRAWGPFEWTVPSALAGRKARLEIKVYTSMIPMFGDPDAPGTCWLRKFYRQPKSPESAPGLLAVEFR